MQLPVGLQHQFAVIEELAAKALVVDPAPGQTHAIGIQQA